MKNIRKNILSVVASALLATGYLLGVSSSPRFVPEGRIGYTKEKQIESSGYYWCSAVILDCEDEAIYFHSKPNEEIETVQEIIKSANYHKMDLSKSFVVINAGMESSLEKLSAGFKDRGIEVRLEDMTFCQEKNNRSSRKVSYSPKENLLRISRGPQTETIELH